ncbi:hypothetical protein HDV00_008160 [Rhizophlyctis rosea]|nr:hypothetical protein HDV00_008160 [Rhizophlyctis rosea]
MPSKDELSRTPSSSFSVEALTSLSDKFRESPGQPEPITEVDLNAGPSVARRRLEEVLLRSLKDRLSSHILWSKKRDPTLEEIIRERALKIYVECQASGKLKRHQLRLDVVTTGRGDEVKIFNFTEQSFGKFYLTCGDLRSMRPFYAISRGVPIIPSHIPKYGMIIYTRDTFKEVEWLCRWHMCRNFSVDVTSIVADSIVEVRTTDYTRRQTLQVRVKEDEFASYNATDKPRRWSPAESPYGERSHKLRKSTLLEDSGSGGQIDTVSKAAKKQKKTVHSEDSITATRKGTQSKQNVGHTEYIDFGIQRDFSTSKDQKSENRGQPRTSDDGTESAMEVHGEAQALFIVEKHSWWKGIGTDVIRQVMSTNGYFSDMAHFYTAIRNQLECDFPTECPQPNQPITNEATRQSRLDQDWANILRRVDGYISAILRGRRTTIRLRAIESLILFFGLPERPAERSRDERARIYNNLFTFRNIWTPEQSSPTPHFEQAWLQAVHQAFDMPTPSMHDLRYLEAVMRLNLQGHTLIEEVMVKDELSNCHGPPAGL